MCEYLWDIKKISLQLESTPGIPSAEVKENLLPYLFKAGIYADRITSEKKSYSEPIALPCS